MRSADERARVLALVGEGLNDCEISRRTGVPRSTVRDMRRPRDRRRTPALRASNCPRCEGRELDRASYAYLLGAYLGDGHITTHRRGVFRLTIFCDLMHVNIARDITLAAWDVRQRRVAMRADRQNMVLVQSYWKHWPCLFPQHGPGMKHTRPIALEPWQQEIVDAHPERLLRGLIHSDGCRSLNRIRHPKRTYEYPRYEFTNHSDDIRRLFCDTCDAIGVRWTRMNRWTISAARREHVAALDAFIGPKT